MISWRWRGHVYDAAYAIVYIIAIIGFTLILLSFYTSYTIHIHPPPPICPPLIILLFIFINILLSFDLYP